MGLVGWSLLNETSTYGSNTIVDPTQSAAYLHIDDGGLFSDSAPAPEADAPPAMLCVADAMQDSGMTVLKRDPEGNTDTFVGYVHCPTPARMELPPVKVHLMDIVIQWLVALRLVPVDLVGSVLGV